MSIKRKIILSISYGDYTKGVGGTDKFILDQQELFLANDISVIHIYPLKNIWMLNLKNKNIWGLVIDGKFKKLITINGILNFLHTLTTSNHVLMGIFIHHLRDINLSELDYLLEKINCQTFFYIHDYMTICPTTGLLKNDKQYCNATFPNSQKCKNCIKASTENEERANQIKRFIDKNGEKIIFIAPSITAMNVWAQVYMKFKQNITVIPHQKLIGNYRNNIELLGAKTSLKIAFIGHQDPIKGWASWKDAISKIHNKNYNYSFFYFGNSKEHIDFVKEIDIDFKKDSNAMINKLRENKIDVAVLWSQCPETYSFTYFEAYASNCYVLTTDKSGNIAYQVKKNNNGEVGNDLYEIISDENKLKDSINQFRKTTTGGPQELASNDCVLKFLDSGEVVIKNGNKDSMYRIISTKVYDYIYKLVNFIKAIKAII